MAWRWSEHGVDGLSKNSILDEAYRSAAGDPRKGRDRRNRVAARLEYVRKRGMESSIPDPETGVRANQAYVGDGITVMFYWAALGRFLVLLMWRRCHDDDVVEGRRHRRTLDASAVKLRRLLVDNGGEIDA